ncbi:MAG: nuclear transport factor 2 family protein [Pseudomonadota bacterium]
MNGGDQAAVCALIARYRRLSDHAGAPEIAAQFRPEGVLEFDGIHEGRAAVEAAYGRWIERKRAPVEGLRRLAYPPAVAFEMEGGGVRGMGTATATAETYFDADGRLRTSGRMIRLRGLYRDRLERRDGVWRFLRKRIEAPPG